MKYLIATLILIAAGYFFLFAKEKPETSTSTLGTTVTSEGSKQVIEIFAKGGYSPAFVSAKANAETILRVKTQGTFDCSSALTIPQLGISKNLPPSGTTSIALGTQQPGTQIDGTCSMGMYNFTLYFN